MEKNSINIIKYNLNKTINLIKNNYMKNFVVCSGGGHLSEILQIKKNSNINKFFFIINSKVNFKNKKRIYFISHGVKGIKLLINFFEIFHIFFKERPNIIISTGASVALPACIIGKLFFNTKFIF